MKDFFQFSRYLFVFAHPDDEIYTCAFIEDLTKKGKIVEVLYVTSGDYQGTEVGEEREKEVRNSMQILGISDNKIHFMRIPERQFMGQIIKVKQDVFQVARKLNPDCIVTHDYEGGHNGHDAVSFCASRAAEDLKTPLFVFPAYYAWPENRLWNQFVSPREATEVLVLTPEKQKLQNEIIATHMSQAGFFNTIKQSTSYNLFSTREVLRMVSKPIDYTRPPTEPVGYEYPGSKIRFEDFKTAVT